MPVECYRESPGKFDSRTLNRKTRNRWTGRNLGPVACRDSAVASLARESGIGLDANRRMVAVIHMYTYIYIYMCLYVLYVYIYIYIYIHMCMCMCMCVYIYIYREREIDTQVININSYSGGAKGECSAKQKCHKRKLYL